MRDGKFKSVFFDGLTKDSNAINGSKGAGNEHMGSGTDPARRLRGHTPGDSTLRQARDYPSHRNRRTPPPFDRYQITLLEVDVSDRLMCGKNLPTVVTWYAANRPGVELATT